MTRKPVYQINPDDLTIIKEWPSVSAAAKELNLPQSSICEAASGKRISANGFYWCFVECYNDFHPRKRCTKKVVCVSTGEIFDSVTAAALALHCKESKVRKCCNKCSGHCSKKERCLKYLECKEKIL